MIDFSQKSSRSLWAQHIHFLHFDEKVPPLYINLVREPVDRLTLSFCFLIEFVDSFLIFTSGDFWTTGRKKRMVKME